MIVVSISSTNIQVDGHAGYAELGKDIICSAVSVLTFNLIKSIESLTKDKIKYQDYTPGHINIEFKNLSERGKLLVDSFFIGISEVATAYPEYVRITGAAPNGRKTEKIEGGTYNEVHEYEKEISNT